MVRSRSAVLATLAVAVAAVAAVAGMRGSPGGGVRAATPRRALEAAAIASGRAGPERDAHGADARLADMREAGPSKAPVRVVLRVWYTNGRRPRGLLLRHRGHQAIVRLNADRGGLFEIEFPPGRHVLEWFYDRVAVHGDDPLPLGTPRTTVDTADPETWDWTVPVAASVVVRDPEHGLPDLWRDGRRVEVAWEEWGSTNGGPAYLAAGYPARGATRPQVARVEPGVYRIERGPAAHRRSRTVTLTASEPCELERP